jgi:hypothetical protein
MEDRQIRVASYVVSVMELKDGKVSRETQYFGDPFEPGPSCAQWVEQMRRSPSGTRRRSQHVPVPIGS